MQVLALAEAPGVTTLLARAVDDRDPEIVGASLALLGRVPDDTAATALIDALKHAKYTPSRVATYLDRFERPLGADLRPLLHHPDPNVRYWGATLLSRHPVDGIDQDLSALASDPAPLVRKAAVASLAQIGGPALAAVARRLLADDTWYVRAHAARALASTGDADVAEEIAPLLADREWWVRLAVKESLQQLGDEVWAVLVPYLDHEDGFARNGAAEVLQNIGVLDSLIVLEAVTARAQQRQARDAAKDRVGGRHPDDGRAARTRRCPDAPARARAAGDTGVGTSGCRVVNDIGIAWLSWLAAASTVLLVAAYGIGAPFLLLRTLLTLSKRRRLRYRTRNDDVLATSRFTIPVSLIVPLESDVDDAPHRVRHLLQLRYPELELIVVVPAGVALEDLKHGLSLSAAEVFYRKSLAGAAVRGLYRSGADPRVIVVHAEPSTPGEAINCGVNLARYRYLAVVDGAATYNGDALLEAMQAALEEPQRVVGATTSLSVRPVEGLDAALRGEAPTGLIDALRYLSAARTRLVTVGRRTTRPAAGRMPRVRDLAARCRARCRRVLRRCHRRARGHDTACARALWRHAHPLPDDSRRRAGGSGRTGRRRAAGATGACALRPDVAPQGPLLQSPLWPPGPVRPAPVWVQPAAGAVGRTVGACGPRARRAARRADRRQAPAGAGHHRARQRHPDGHGAAADRPDGARSPAGRALQSAPGWTI